MVSVTLFLVALLIAAYLWAAGTRAKRRAKRYRRLALTEQTRSLWAETRVDLFNLVRDGRLNPRSQTFRTLYTLQTFVLRRPDAYEEIARAMREALFSPPAPSPQWWINEQAAWPAELRPILTKMAEGTRLLAFGYAGMPALVYRLWRHSPGLATHLIRTYLHPVWKRVRSTRRVSVKRDLDEARRQLKALAGDRLSPSLTPRAA